jgi:hypothetical protein
VDQKVRGSSPFECAVADASLVEYYDKLGVEQAVIDCYVPILTELGVTSITQLEDDQGLGAEATAAFDDCVERFGTTEP